MNTMIMNSTNVARISGLRPRVDLVAPVYARAGKHHAGFGATAMGFTPTDNSTGVSAVERRRS